MGGCSCTSGAQAGHDHKQGATSGVGLEEDRAATCACHAPACAYWHVLQDRAPAGEPVQPLPAALPAPGVLSSVGGSGCRRGCMPAWVLRQLATRACNSAASPAIHPHLSAPACCPACSLPLLQSAAKVAGLSQPTKAAFVAVLTRTCSGAGEPVPAAPVASRRAACINPKLHASDASDVTDASSYPSLPAWPGLACPAAHPHTKLATLVYCESLCGDVGVVQEMVNGEAGVALVGAWDWDRLLEGW